MIRKRPFVLIMLLLLAAAVPPAIGGGIPGERAGAFVGQDLHLRGAEVISYQPAGGEPRPSLMGEGEHVLVFEDGFTLSVGANRFSSDRAVVWLESEPAEFRGGIYVDVKGQAYLEGNVSAEKGKTAQTSDLSETVLESPNGVEDKDGRVVVIRFSVGGEVFVTADKRDVSDPRGLELYARAISAVRAVPAGPRFVVKPGAIVPEIAYFAAAAAKTEPAKEIPEKPVKKPVAAKPKQPVERRVAERAVERERPVEDEVKFRYPVNWAPAGEVKPVVERTRAADGTDIATVIGRIYVWQKQDEKGGLLELLSDSAVIFYSGQAPESDEQRPLEMGGVKAVYMSGDVVITEGQRTIRADEIYYDFERRKAIAVNAVMRNFDVSRGIPIYVRAARLRQLAENKFAADNITLTSSEFYVPQISLSASSVFITDTTAVDEQLGKISDSSYDAEMRDVRLKMDDTTVFYWPFMRSNLQRPDIPLKGAHVGHDNTWGTSLETEWYLSRLLGLREPEGTESTLSLDYYGERGLGAGAEIEYERENYYGRALGYLIHDSGEDRLGRHESRKDLEPNRRLRGRFAWRHRHFLPFNWQLTTGVGYASDERFIEGYYRSEFNVGREETYIHLKRIEDNWGLSILGKGRINDFDDELEELPGVEFHLTGESLFEDRFTLYSDTQVGRRRQRIGNEHSTLIDEQMFSFVSHRVELDMPMRLGIRNPKSAARDSLRVVPFVAGTFGYDDRSGFRRTLVDGSYTGRFGEDKVALGEAGVRLSSQYWKVYPNVKSRLWDLEGLRHIIKPQLAAALYAENDNVVEQRDTLNVGLSQRLQTRRRRSPFVNNESLHSPRDSLRRTPDGGATSYETVDWMRLDVGTTWVRDSGDASAGPDRFVWNRPIVPLRVLSAPDIYSGDLTNNLHRFEMYGPRRNYFGADYIWRVSDTTAVLSDMNLDIQSGVVQQFNVGFSRLCWPNLSFYVGSRYLRRIEVLDEKGSNAFTFAATYVLDPRYTVVFAQQFDFDYGANIRSDITLIRRYHRMYCGFTYSADESLDRQAIVFSIWPQGVPELVIGPRRYMGLGGPAGYR